MSNSFTEVTNQSWFSRIKNALVGIIIGAILFIGAFPLLFINEGRAVKRYKTLKEGGGIVQTVAIDSVDPGNTGKLIHLTGDATTEDILNDSTFGVSENAIHLSRKVEMYQWKEETETKTKKKVGGGTKKTKTYSYKKVWSSNAISSSSFKKPEGHQNPGTIPYNSQQMSADLVTVGAFRLSPSLINRFSNWTALNLSSDTQLPETLSHKAQLQTDGFYIGTNPASPEIGDLRVSFRVAYPAEISVIASQVSDTFEPYQTEAGGTIELLEMGTHSSEAMIQQAQTDNKILTWMLRVLGIILMFAGLRIMMNIFSVLADVIPLFGNIVGFGTSMIAFFIAAILSFGTIGIAWVAYRPLIGIPILLAGAALLVLLIVKIKGAAKKV